MPATSFPECLSVGVITAVFKFGEKPDMSNYRGITVGPVFAELSAMIIERRLASWAEEHRVKARGQAGFHKNYRTTDNIFVLRSLIEKRKQARQKRGSGKAILMFCGLRKSVQYCTACFAVAGARRPGCAREGVGHHQVYVCTRQRCSTHITRTF